MCVKVEVDVLHGLPVPNNPYGLCGNEAALNLNLTFVVSSSLLPLPVAVNGMLKIHYCVFLVFSSFVNFADSFEISPWTVQGCFPPRNQLRQLRHCLAMYGPRSLPMDS